MYVAVTRIVAAVRAIPHYFAVDKKVAIHNWMHFTNQPIMCSLPRLISCLTNILILALSVQNRMIMRCSAIILIKQRFIEFEMNPHLESSIQQRRPAVSISQTKIITI